MITICGIAGISYGPDGPTAEDWSPTELLQILLPASVHRGPHAFGWMYCTKDGKVHYAKYKGKSNAKGAVAKMVIKPEHEPDVVWIVGHVRYFTNGTPDNMHNNHPIHHKNIIGVHNGVIHNFRQILSETGRQHDDAEVDSEAIFAAINKWGHRAGLRRIRGDMVAVYSNLQKPEVLHIARTKNRPIVFTHTRGGSIMFASEEGIIESTGMAASPYTSLSLNRLVRVKGGRIVERVTLQQPTEEWRKFEGAAEYTGPDRDDVDAGNLAPMRRPHAWQPPKLNKNQKPRTLETLQEAERIMKEGEKPAPTKSDGVAVTRPTKPARGYARSSSLRDGDAVGSKIYFGGLLLTREEYVLQVNGRSKTSLDEG